MGARPLGLAKLLLIATALYNVAEGVIAIWSGVAAGSLALIAFGADSYLEVAAAAAGDAAYRLDLPCPGCRCDLPGFRSHSRARGRGRVAGGYRARAGFRHRDAASRSGEAPDGGHDETCRPGCGGQGDACLLVPLRLSATRTRSQRYPGLVVARSCNRTGDRSLVGQRGSGGCARRRVFRRIDGLLLPLVFLRNTQVPGRLLFGRRLACSSVCSPAALPASRGAASCRSPSAFAG